MNVCIFGVSIKEQIKLIKVRKFIIYISVFVFANLRIQIKFVKFSLFSIIGYFQQRVRKRHPTLVLTMRNELPTITYDFSLEWSEEQVKRAFESFFTAVTTIVEDFS